MDILLTMDILLIAGLVLTDVGLYLMDGLGQPALLHLVPRTLGYILKLASDEDSIKPV